MYPEAKSVGRWLAHGWHVALAYVVGFFVLMLVLGWHPHRQARRKPLSLILHCGIYGGARTVLESRG